MNVHLGKGVDLDAMQLIDTRLLLVGNSGAGKSYLVRVLAEQVVGKIPTIILDREGEFATLREQHDVVLVGEGGEADTSVATAAKLARTLVELKVSAVINLYELSKGEKRKFVRLFLDAILNLPRSLWRPMFVIVDEAHEFCPERGRDAESRESVERLMDQGRKRGIGGVLATQRFAKLSKDAAGEANNVLIGRIVQDVDLHRASDTLGFSGKSEWPTLRQLDPGEWFGFGPAFEQRGIVRFRCAKAKTTHPKAGQRHRLQPPAPSNAILKVAPELAALKQKVEEEKSELERLREENRALKSASRTGKPTPATVPVDTAQHVLAGRDDVLRMVEPAVHSVIGARKLALEAMHAGWSQAKIELDKAVNELIHVSARKNFGKVPKAVRTTSNGRAQVPDPNTDPDENARWHRASLKLRREREHESRGHTSTTASDPSIGKGTLRRMMIALAQNPDGLERAQLAMFSQCSARSSSYSNNLSTMRTKAWMEDGTDRKLRITAAGLDALGGFEPLPRGDALVLYWLDFCGHGAKRRVLQALLDAGDKGLSRSALAAAAEVSEVSSSYSNSLSELRVAHLAEGSKIIRASSDLLSELS